MSTSDQAGASMRTVSTGAGASTRPAVTDDTRPVPTATPPAPPATSGDGSGATTTAPTSTPRPAPSGVRRVRLTVSRVDPWSTMKLSFLLSVAMGIAGVIATAMLWTMLKAMGVFDKVNGMVGQILGSGSDGGQKFDLMDFVGFDRVLALAIVVAVIDVILMTAIATLGAFLYNVCSSLVGGLQLTLTDD